MIAAKTQQGLCQILPAFVEAGPRHRNRYCNRTSERIQDGYADGANAGIVFAQIESEMVAPRRRNFF